MGNPGHAKNNTFDLFWIKHDKTPFCWFQSILLLFETHNFPVLSHHAPKFRLQGGSQKAKTRPTKPADFQHMDITSLKPANFVGSISNCVGINSEHKIKLLNNG
jgi:hypothetical protein